MKGVIHRRAVTPTSQSIGLFLNTLTKLAQLLVVAAFIILSVPSALAVNTESQLSAMST